MAFGADEFGVGPVFGDDPVFDDQDTVGSFDGREAVGNDEAGTAVHQLSLSPESTPRLARDNKPATKLGLDKPISS